MDKSKIKTTFKLEIPHWQESLERCIEYINELMSKRKDFYEEAADYKVATDGKNVSQICQEIITILSK